MLERKNQMTIGHEAQKILDYIYKAYGTNSGILFGIDSPKTVAIIIQLALNYTRKKSDAIEKILEQVLMKHHDDISKQDDDAIAEARDAILDLITKEAQ